MQVCVGLGDGGEVRSEGCYETLVMAWVKVWCKGLLDYRFSGRSMGAPRKGVGGFWEASGDVGCESVHFERGLCII